VKPKTIEIVNNILAIVWDDGQESYIGFDALRRACPCALCKGETNILVASKPAPGNYTMASFELRGWQFVGGYGLQPQWADGHAAGIFSFDYLRKLESNP
jgi:DUF971 family protein